MSIASGTTSKYDIDMLLASIENLDHVLALKYNTTAVHSTDFQTKLYQYIKYISTVYDYLHQYSTAPVSQYDTTLPNELDTRKLLKHIVAAVRRHDTLRCAATPGLS